MSRSTGAVNTVGIKHFVGRYTPMSKVENFVNLNHLGVSKSGDVIPKERIKKLNFRIPSDLHKKYSILSFALGESRNKLYIQALRNFILNVDWNEIGDKIKEKYENV